MVAARSVGLMGWLTSGEASTLELLKIHGRVCGMRDPRQSRLGGDDLVVQDQFACGTSYGLENT